MKAAVTTRAGQPEVIKIQEVPLPEVKPGWVLIQIKAFGLNRSELFTRRGDSPGVSFPRIQGIECVGIIQEDPSGTYKKGQQVAAIMGGMGYSTDLEPSFMLGTGTWSGSITSDNVTALHLINIKRVAYENRPWRDIYEEYGA